MHLIGRHLKTIVFVREQVESFIYDERVLNWFQRGRVVLPSDSLDGLRSEGVIKSGES